jgi:RHS repeat-associated protein
VQTNEVRYVYDGMVVVQERHYDPRLSTSLPQLVVSYTRGRDLSGTLQGAGGIGGLLARTESGPLALGGNLATALYYGDNVGNITCLVGTNGQVLARYLYEPFGNILGMSGPLAERNLYRFSSKEWHENSGLVYYGYRYYSPSLQRWINRDLLGESAGFNLYAYGLNSPSTTVDPDGLFPLLPVLGAVAVSLAWEAGCAAYAHHQAEAMNYPNDSHQFKKHCLVGCLYRKCMLFQQSAMAGQFVHEALIALYHDWRPWKWDWREVISDTLATKLGDLFAFKGLFGDCRRDCDCKLLDSSR